MRSLAAFGLLILVALPPAAGAEEFEVIVLRGGEVRRVTGDERGPISEVTIREAPEPPAPPPEAEHRDSPPDSPVLVLHLEVLDGGDGIQLVPGHPPLAGQARLHRARLPHAPSHPSRMTRQGRVRTSGALLRRAGGS